MPNEFPGEEPEPRWPAIASIVAVGGLYMALPSSLAVGPRWLQLVIVLILLIPTIITHRRGHHQLNILLGHLLSGIMTIFMVWSLALLIHALLTNQEKASSMLRSAAALWLTNILVFAMWYWRLDAGGPHARDRRAGHQAGAFLFPQMSMDQSMMDETDERPWSPRFIDYLFLAFNCSTALSPTDAPVLSRWAKVLVMLQASISLCTIVTLAARAVNIL